MTSYHRIAPGARGRQTELWRREPHGYARARGIKIRGKLSHPPHRLGYYEQPDLVPYETGFPEIEAWLRERNKTGEYAPPPKTVVKPGAPPAADAGPAIVALRAACARGTDATVAAFRAIPEASRVSTAGLAATAGVDARCLTSALSVLAEEKRSKQVRNLLIGAAGIAVVALLISRK